MGVDANAHLIYGYVETQSKINLSEMEDLDGEDYARWEKIAENLNISTGLLGDSSRYIAAASFVTTHRWVEIIEPEKLVVQPQWEGNLKAYAKAVNIDLGEEKPQWILLAYFD